MVNGQTGSPGPDNRSSPLKIWGPPCSVAVLILIFSSTPGSYYPRHPDLLNNLLHFTQFGLLGFLLARALNYKVTHPGMGLFLLTTAICATFGLLDEAHQFLVPQRVFDLMDLVFDTAGAVVGSASYIFIKTFVSDSSGSTDAAGDRDDR